MFVVSGNGYGQRMKRIKSVKNRRLDFGGGHTVYRSHVIKIHIDIYTMSLLTNVSPIHWIKNTLKIL